MTWINRRRAWQREKSSSWILFLTSSPIMIDTKWIHSLNASLLMTATLVLWTITWVTSFIRIILFNFIYFSGDNGRCIFLLIFLFLRLVLLRVLLFVLLSSSVHSFIPGNCKGKPALFFTRICKTQSLEMSMLRKFWLSLSDPPRNHRLEFELACDPPERLFFSFSYNLNLWFFLPLLAPLHVSLLQYWDGHLRMNVVECYLVWSQASIIGKKFGWVMNERIWIYFQA